VSEGWCAALQLLLVPLVTGLNGIGIYLLRRIAGAVEGERSPRDGDAGFRPLP
jgi:hypothetical protein